MAHIFGTPGTPFSATLRRVLGEDGGASFWQNASPETKRRHQQLMTNKIAQQENRRQVAARQRNIVQQEINSVENEQTQIDIAENSEKGQLETFKQQKEAEKHAIIRQAVGHLLDPIDTEIQQTEQRFLKNSGQRQAKYYQLDNRVQELITTQQGHDEVIAECSESITFIKATMTGNNIKVTPNLEQLNDLEDLRSNEELFRRSQFQDTVKYPDPKLFDILERWSKKKLAKSPAMLELWEDLSPDTFEAAGLNPAEYNNGKPRLFFASSSTREVLIARICIYAQLELD